MTNNYVHRVIVVILMVLLCAVVPSYINAGDYHNSKAKGAVQETLACSQCHTMHNSQGGNEMIYNSDTDASNALGKPKLLRASSILNLCLHCHGDNGFSPTTVDGRRTPPKVLNNPTTTYVPSAGDFGNRGVEYEENRHSINNNDLIPPGYVGAEWADVQSSFSNTFNCLYCHAQHGNTNYRNLRYDPSSPTNDKAGIGVKINYATQVGANPVPTVCSDGTATPCDVFVVNPGGTTAVGTNLEKYERSNVTFSVSTANAAGDGTNGISQFCGKCHTNFYGSSGDANMGGAAAAGVGAGDTGGNPWVRHPVGDITFNQSANSGNAHVDNENLVNNANDGTFTLIRYADGGNWPPGGYTDTAANAFGTVTGTGFNTTLSGEQPFCLTCHYAHGGGNSNHPDAVGGGSYAPYDHSMLVFTDNDGDVNIKRDGTYDNTQHYMRNTCNQCHNQ